MSDVCPKCGAGRALYDAAAFECGSSWMGISLPRDEWRLGEGTNCLRRQRVLGRRRIAVEKALRERAEARLRAFDGIDPARVEVHAGNCTGDAPAIVCLGCEQAAQERWFAETDREHLAREKAEAACVVETEPSAWRVACPQGREYDCFIYSAREDADRDSHSFAEDDIDGLRPKPTDQEKEIRERYKPVPLYALSVCGQGLLDELARVKEEAVKLRTLNTFLLAKVQKFEKEKTP